MGHLSRHAAEVSTWAFEAHDWEAGARILNIADKTNSDVIVMGAYGHSQWREFFLGGATRYVLNSWGIITLLRDDPNFFVEVSSGDEFSRPDNVKTGAMTDAVALDVSYEVTTWLSATNVDPGSALYGKVDTRRVGLAGHSYGVRIALVVGEALPGRIKGVFGLDPVDMSAREPARPKLASIGVPVAFIGETTNRFSCAPGWFNFQALYRAAGSPAVAITAIKADHTMFEDPAHCSRCWFCKPAGTAAASKVLAYSVRYLTAFFARELMGDVSVGSAFEGAGSAADVNAGLIELSSK